MHFTAFASLLAASAYARFTNGHKEWVDGPVTWYAPAEMKTYLLIHPGDDNKDDYSSTICFRFSAPRYEKYNALSVDQFNKKFQLQSQGRVDLFDKLDVKGELFKADIGDKPGFCFGAYFPNTPDRFVILGRRRWYRFWMKKVVSRSFAMKLSVSPSTVIKSLGPNASAEDIDAALRKHSKDNPIYTAPEHILRAISENPKLYKHYENGDYTNDPQADKHTGAIRWSSFLSKLNF